MLTYTWGDVEFFGWCSDIKRIRCYFCCLNHRAAGKCESFIGWFPCAMAWVICGSNTRCGSAVGNGGWDCSVHYSSAEFLIVDSKYVLSFCLGNRGFHCVGQESFSLPSSQLCVTILQTLRNHLVWPARPYLFPFICYLISTAGLFYGSNLALAECYSAFWLVLFDLARRRG